MVKPEVHLSCHTAVWHTPVACMALGPTLKLQSTYQITETDDFGSIFWRQRSNMELLGFLSKLVLFSREMKFSKKDGLP